MVENVENNEQLLEDLERILNGQVHRSGTTKFGPCNINKFQGRYMIALIGPEKGVETVFALDFEGNYIYAKSFKPARQLPLEEGGRIVPEESVELTVTLDEIVLSFEEGV